MIHSTSSVSALTVVINCFPSILELPNYKILREIKNKQAPEMLTRKENKRDWSATKLVIDGNPGTNRPWNTKPLAALFHHIC